ASHDNPVEIMSKEPAQPGRFGYPRGRRGSCVPTGHLAWRRWFLIAQHPRDFEHRRRLKTISTEGDDAAKQFIENCAQSVDIGPRVHLSGFAKRLLRSHVVDRTNE